MMAQRHGRSGPLRRRLRWAIVAGALLLLAPLPAQLPSETAGGPRRHERLDRDWRVHVVPAGAPAPADAAEPAADESRWTAVEVPHNADTYHGYRQVKHGNLHGSAWYRRRFTVDAADRGRRVFLFFEGVGSYATVWVNGREVGRHAGGLTTFTLDVTEAIRFEGPNLLAVRADHPAGIRDLPWVCGGCERAYGFSEGSQPFGIFRPVHLVVTDPVRIAPFGVHVWNDRNVSAARATAHVRTEITHHGEGEQTLTLRTELLDATSLVVAQTSTPVRLAPGATLTVPQALEVESVRLWSLEDPYRYRVRTRLTDPHGRERDRVDTPFGFRWIDWPHGEDAARGTFLLNGRPVFLNGTCEYSHQLGGGHAFSDQQIAARVGMIRAAGFNAFRDAHHPHNLRYQAHWDRHGLAWWTQFGAQIWFDSPAFRANYRALLRDWVRERRNSPSLVLWGLQNESRLPVAFARECTELIRELDPTARDQRLVVTCNGGDGTDWDVPQNWTGTYGGDPSTYADDLRRQVLVGEYGGWRSAGLHVPPGTRSPVGYDEEYFTGLMETKVRLAETVRDQVAGHFQWIFVTHDNPGRTFGARGEQLADGWGRLDRIGPANNKGLFTTWGEPVDAFYMYRSNYAPVATEPMVALAAASWPDRWTAPGMVDGIIAYSNADEVELFNDEGRTSLGTRRRGARGTHFRWDGVPLRYGMLHAVARQDGRVVATDTILLHHLPPPPGESDESAAASPDLDVDAWEPRFLVNCGGPEYVDRYGQRWAADQPWRAGRTWGAFSWADAWPHLPPELGSVRRVHVPIAGTRDDPLYQSFRYGRGALRYRFEVPPGEYRIELLFAEPWYGRGGGLDATGWRQFDVAVNDQVVLRDLDLWREAGYARALRKVVAADAPDGRLEISFPRVASHQAVIAAIAIWARAPGAAVGHDVDSDPEPDVIAVGGSVEQVFDTGLRAFADRTTTVAGLPEALRHRLWVRRHHAGLAAPLTVRSTTAGEWHLADTTPVSGDSTPPGDTLRLAGPDAGLYAWRRRPVAAGEALTLTNVALAVFVPERPPAPGQVIRNLRVSHSAHPDGWRAVGNLQRGDRPHGAERAGLDQIPSDLTDSDWLQLPALEPSPALEVRFETADHAEVLVALPAEADLPAWLQDWVPDPGKVAAGDNAFRLFRRRYPTGATVTLGRNGLRADGAPAPMYAVFVRPVRPSITYPAGETDAGITLAAPGAVHRWTLQVGVGDRYGFVIPYDPPRTEVRVQYRFLNASGEVLCEDTFNLPANSADPSPELRVRTCTSVNAGTYAVDVELLDGAEVTLRSLTVE